MATLYRTGWTGDCLAIAGQVGAVSFAFMAVGCLLVFLVLRFVIARRLQAVFGWRTQVMVFVPVMLAVIVYTGLSGTTTHRILVNGTGLVFEGCDGLRPFSDTVRFDRIAASSLRSQAGGRGRARDEVVLTLHGGGAVRIIPLSTDPARLDPAVLRRAVPPGVVQAYRDALVQRGVAVPAGL